MGSHPIPIEVSAPRSPTPPPPGDERLSTSSGGGLGLHGLGAPLSSTVSRDSSLLAPDDGYSPPRQRSTPSLMPADASESAVVDDGGNDGGPFRFQSRAYTPNLAGSASPRSPHKSVVSQVMGQRRGHRYKHSSVSHQIFLEPAPRAPLRLPASLPVPTTREGWASMSTEQTLRVAWCFCHLFVAGYVQWTAQGSLALTALSHLIFYDAIGAFLCAAVEVLSNFEVWKRSSIRHPFGLERSEVLVGFAMSILLLFMGFDLISHNVSHMLDAHDDGHEAHRPHEHAERVPAHSLDISVLLAIGSTLVSALMLRNHARIARSLRFARVALLPPLLNNPSHLFTLSCSVALLGMPLLSLDAYRRTDSALSTGMACAMCLLGYHLVRTLGAMLLMSYSPPSEHPSSSASSAAAKKNPTTVVHGPGSSTTVHAVIADIETDPNVARVAEAKFWQVHYGLCLANLSLRVRGTEDALARLRERVQSLVRTRLGGGYGATGGTAWEVSIEMVWDRDGGAAGAGTARR